MEFKYEANPIVEEIRERLNIAAIEKTAALRALRASANDMRPAAQQRLHLADAVYNAIRLELLAAEKA